MCLVFMSCCFINAVFVLCPYCAFYSLAPVLIVVVRYFTVGLLDDS
jgi:hypothetical protein